MELNDLGLFPTGGVRNSASFKEPTWRVSLGYRFSRTIYGYATYSRGFKGGGYNDKIGSFAPFGANLDAFAAAAATTDPETDDSYEAGGTTEFLDRRLRFTPTGFNAKNKDLQKTN